jgi:hypothetical protein
MFRGFFNFLVFFKYIENRSDLAWQWPNPVNLPVCRERLKNLEMIERETCPEGRASNLSILSFLLT